MVLFTIYIYKEINRGLIEVEVGTTYVSKEDISPIKIINLGDLQDFLPTSFFFTVQITTSHLVFLHTYKTEDYNMYYRSYFYVASMVARSGWSNARSVWVALSMACRH